MTYFCFSSQRRAKLKPYKFGTWQRHKRIITDDGDWLPNIHTISQFTTLSRRMNLLSQHHDGFPIDGFYATYLTLEHNWLL